MATEALQLDPMSATAINRRLRNVDEKKHHHADQSTRTSLTLSGSWAITAVSEPAGAGISVPALLQPLLGIDFLPYTPSSACSGVPEEEPTHNNGVPRSVEISAEEQQSTGNDGGFPVTPRLEDDDETSVHSISRHCSPPLKPEETEELQQLLLERKQSARKKKKKGFKAAARAVLHRVSATKKKSSKNRRHSEPLKIDTNLLSPTSVSALPSAMNHQRQHEESAGHEISPTATTATEGTLSPLGCINLENDEKLRCLRHEAHTQEDTMKETYGEIEDLQSKLAIQLANYESQLANFQTTQKKLEQLTQKVSVAKEHQKETPMPKDTMLTGKQQRMYKRSESGTFIRVHDLELSKSSSSRSSEDDDHSLSSLSQSGRADSNQLGLPTPEFLLVDHYLQEIVQQLIFVGFDLATDESDRYTPTKDTAKLISHHQQKSANTNCNGWPIHPWTPAMNQEVLVWTGRVSHEGFGHTWPVVKGRAILHTSAKNVLAYMWDSSLVPKYNPMCQGRDDLYILQNDVGMTAQESPYGFAGCAKIVRSLNKHRLLPKGIEMKSLLYARPLKEHKGSYIIVSRSVWENDNAEHSSKTVVRTEMLMGCTIVRAIDENTCEMTQLTHVHMPGVPELVARRTAPNQCLSLMKALQSIFK